VPLRRTLAANGRSTKQPVVLAIRQVTGGLGDAVVVVVDRSRGDDVVDAVEAASSRAGRGAKRRS
jgi:hypothetical protein